MAGLYNHPRKGPAQDHANPTKSRHILSCTELHPVDLDTASHKAKGPTRLSFPARKAHHAGRHRRCDISATTTWPTDLVERSSAAHRKPALCSISGLGHFLPDHVITNADIALHVDTNDQWIVERTGIHGRHRAAKDEATSDLAHKAAMLALSDAHLVASDLDLILLATSTPDQPVPSTACYLQAKLGCRGVPACDVAAGCSGFGYALQMATACVKAGIHQRVLVIGADCLTRITNYADRQSCILFGDGAGAVVVAKDGFMDLIHTEIGAEGSAADLIQIRAGGSREPACAASVAGLRHTLELQGREVFKVAVRQMTDCIRRAASSVGIAVSDFDLIIPHQANARIIESVGKHLEVNPDRVVIDIADTGNMASASIPVALGRAREAGRLKPGQTIAVVGFGAGTTWACQVLRMREASRLREPRPQATGPSPTLPTEQRPSGSCPLHPTVAPLPNR